MIMVLNSIGKICCEYQIIDQETFSRGYCSAFEQVVLPGIRRLINASIINPLAGRATFLSPTVHGRSDNIVVFP